MLRATSRRLVLAGILSILSISAALAQTEKVYVTRTGTKYHRDFCSSLRSTKIEMSLAEAAARYGPCRICRPPVPEAVPRHTPALPAADTAAPTPSPPAASTAPAARSGRCQATTKKGTQCSRNPKPGSNYCWQHGG
jgi:hypothetical protein